MKSFWISLIVFCLLLCSCKTQKIDSNVKERSEIQSELSYLNESVKIDTTKTVHSEQLNQRIIIEEETTIIEYDKESGKPIKKTNAKRKTTQDSEKVVAEETKGGMSEGNKEKQDQSSSESKKVDSEVKEESIGGQESFGKWLGIILGLGIIFGIVYLCRKLRIN